MLAKTTTRVFQTLLCFECGGQQGGFAIGVDRPNFCRSSYLEIGPNGERIIATCFELIIKLFQKAA